MKHDELTIKRDLATALAGEILEGAIAITGPEASGVALAAITMAMTTLAAACNMGEDFLVEQVRIRYRQDQAAATALRAQLAAGKILVEQAPAGTPGPTGSAN